VEVDQGEKEYPNRPSKKLKLIYTSSLLTIGEKVEKYHLLGFGSMQRRFIMKRRPQILSTGSPNLSRHHLGG